MQMRISPWRCVYRLNLLYNGHLWWRWNVAIRKTAIPECIAPPNSVKTCIQLNFVKGNLLSHLVHTLFQSLMCTYPVSLCFSAQAARTHTHLSCASLPHSTQTESQCHRSLITSLPCYFIVLHGSFVRLGVQTCWVNLMLIEPQRKLSVKLTELTVFNGKREFKCFCTSILVLLPFLVLFFIAYHDRLLALCSATHF